jgi:hypothetical protein
VVRSRAERCGEPWDPISVVKKGWGILTANLDKFSGFSGLIWFDGDVNMCLSNKIRGS